ncbi:hypothetical protein H2200_002950 [Cladophialophora chaetospira]|uniref:MHYT domain-containing protein n=1 Tax=Cladophialophora chaetospira TaxID=386627 RepID=A0AA39CL11_9EURO|nr:hypothetical protein H2200_002950 [Cladophialophora chaetospira]
MGGIGIWGMHFVGNRAIVLQHGDPQRQILYNSGFTAISFFLPIVVLLFAFYTLGMPTRVRQLHVAVAGFFTGAAVCGMHYLGQYSVENYTCSYRVQYVVGAAIIAVLASFIALSIFFRLRDAWMDSWWKRALCGAILATAVSGMHWTAAVGTIYHWHGDLRGHGNSRSQTAVIAAALSMSSCVVLLIVAFIRGRNKRTAKVKAQRLVLACAYFDEEGNLMVTQEGSLPSEKITNHYVEKTFGEDELSRSHPTYLWIFKASRNWALFRDLIPGMKEYIETDPVARKYRAGNTGQNLSEDTIDGSLNFAPIFKQLFCVAAQHLANLTHEPLEKLGVLFEEPLETGAALAHQQQFGVRVLSTKGYSNAPEAESGASSPLTGAKGKYFFLHRQINKGEAAKFAALGYRFATVGQIAEPLAKSMQVHRDRLTTRIERMRLSASPDHLLPPGVHLSCFMIRPSMYKSFDVLVPTSSQNHVPYVTMQSGNLSADQLAELQRFDNLNVSEILRTLLNKSNTSKIGEEIRWQLYNAFVKLVEILGDYDTMMEAKFSATVFRVPCRSPRDTTASPATCTLLTVRVLRSIHAASNRKELTYVPLSFFGAQQQVQACDRDELFEQKVRAEFRHPAQGATKHSSTISVRDTQSPDSGASTVHGPESPRSGLFRIGRFSILPGRRSDEATFVEREKSIAEGSDMEMGPMSESAHLDKEHRVTHSDVAELKQAGSNWVNEVFGLFRLGQEGWSTVKSEWKWDINVENTFEVGSKDRNQSVNDTRVKEIF